MDRVKPADSPAPFSPTPDVAAIVDLLLDGFEARGGHPKRAVRVKLRQASACLPGYYSQEDPQPRIVANEQLAALKARGWVTLEWEPAQEGHLLASVTLVPEAANALYALIEREPLAAQRRRLRDLLLGNRFRVRDWRRLALDRTLRKLEEHKSPTPFKLGDEAWNRDLLDALLALPAETTLELPYRVFSVRVFNDSKRFNDLKSAVARLARRGHGEWRGLTHREVLRELGLVPNPTHVHMAGPWRLVDEEGELLSLAPFRPSVGIPARLAAKVATAWVDAERVICVENLTPFYTLVQQKGEGLAALCLWGNPSPACRHLLRRLAERLPAQVPLYVWADIDYGGLNILAQLRARVSPRFAPYHMDVATLDAFAKWGQPLTRRDVRNLERLRDHPALQDVVPLIDEMLLREVKLEQEALDPAQVWAE
jgi:hypothetical protein